jgi:hypothetical protein
MAASDMSDSDNTHPKIDEGYTQEKHSNSADLPGTHNHQMGELVAFDVPGQVQTSDSNILRSKFNGFQTKEAE